MSAEIADALLTDFSRQHVWEEVRKVSYAPLKFKTHLFVFYKSSWHWICVLSQILKLFGYWILIGRSYIYFQHFRILCFQMFDRFIGLSITQVWCTSVSFLKMTRTVRKSDPGKKSRTKRWICLIRTQGSYLSQLIRLVSIASVSGSGFQ
jgi:hypothetical protein